MREILFRGKRVDNGEWAYGSYVHIVQYKESTDYIADEEPDQYVVIPETVGQYTGLCDKNGTKIFEGDIVETKYGRWDQVIWFSSPRGQRWNLIPLEDKHKCPDDYDLWAPKNLEVIGNIHDNFELLNK